MRECIRCDSLILGVEIRLICWRRWRDFLVYRALISRVFLLICDCYWANECVELNGAVSADGNPVSVYGYSVLIDRTIVGGADK